MKVAIANFSPPLAGAEDFAAYWRGQSRPPPASSRVSLLEQEPGWGFHITALGVYLLDRGCADDVELWDYAARRRAYRQPSGVLNRTFLNADDLEAYLERFGDPDLFVNHGRHGAEMLQRLEGRCFRAHVPAMRAGLEQTANAGADCYLVDAEEYLDDRSLLYVPVVNTARIRPLACPKRRDFVYLAADYEGKRHDIVVNAVRDTGLTGHFHPVDGSALDLSGTGITTSAWGEIDLVELLQTSRIAVYPADRTSNPASMWECVAAGLPIVVNREILGGKHLVVSGVTGELAREDEFLEVMERVLADVDSYVPREHFDEHWDTVETIESQLAFFARMGWAGWPCS